MIQVGSTVQIVKTRFAGRYGEVVQTDACLAAQPCREPLFRVQFLNGDWYWFELSELDPIIESPK